MRFAGLDERLRPHADATVGYAEKAGLHPVIISVRRRFDEQAKLYSDYRAGLSKWPAAPPGESAHQYGVAFDVVVPAEEQAAWNYIRRGFGWRVSDGDPPHAEFPGWQSVRQYLRYS